MQDSTVREVPLTQGKFALVDAADYETVIAHPYPWRAVCVSGIWYAVAQASRRSGIRVKHVFMHRFLLNPPRGRIVDHIDGNGLNNSRSNIRIASTAQNGGNRRKHIAKTSSYKGVSFHKGRQKWHAIIIVDGVKIHIGSLADEVEAARAYDEAARKYFKGFARPNFP